MASLSCTASSRQARAIWKEGEQGGKRTEKREEERRRGEEWERGGEGTKDSAGERSAVAEGLPSTRWSLSSIPNTEKEKRVEGRGKERQKDLYCLSYQLFFW